MSPAVYRVKCLDNLTPYYTFSKTGISIDVSKKYQQKGKHFNPEQIILFSSLILVYTIISGIEPTLKNNMVI